MNKLIIPLIFIACLFLTACNNSDSEPEVYPIRFAQQTYTIKMGVTTPISYVDGGDVYDVEIGNPAVIGKAGIDIETHCLMITPIAVGESTITVKDKRAESTIILNITVTDFYLGFKVERIEGESSNPYITPNSEIRYIRTSENKKFLRIINYDNLSQKEKVIAEGVFDMIKGDKEFILDMVLHCGEHEEPEYFSYSVKGYEGVFDIFNRCFEFGWEKSPKSRTLPMPRVNMDLTDMNNGCQINTVYVY